MLDIAAVDWPQGTVVTAFSHTFVEASRAVAAPTTRQDDCVDLSVADLASWTKWNDDKPVEDDQKVEEDDQATNGLLAERKSGCIKHFDS